MKKERLEEFEKVKELMKKYIKEAIRQNIITYFKKRGKRYKRYIKPSCEFIFEGVSNE